MMDWTSHTIKKQNENHSYQNRKSLRNFFDSSTFLPIRSYTFRHSVPLQAWLRVTFVCLRQPYITNLAAQTKGALNHGRETCIQCSPERKLLAVQKQTLFVLQQRAICKIVCDLEHPKRTYFVIWKTDLIKNLQKIMPDEGKHLKKIKTRE